MDKISSVLSIAVTAQVLIAAAVGVFVAWSNQKSRADLAAFRADLFKSWDEKLSSYLTAAHFQLYSESHAKEHLDIHAEITRLRDFRHDTNGTIRGLGTKLEDMAADIHTLTERIDELMKR